MYHIFLNQDIFRKNALELLKFVKALDEGQMEGTVSQILYIGFSFCFMQSRKINYQKIPKVSRFFLLYKIKTRTKLRNLRDGSLH